MRDLILKKPVTIICILSLIFASCIFILAFRLSYSRQASQYTRTAAVAAEKMNLSLEMTGVIVQSIAWSKQLRSQDIDGIKWTVQRMHGLYPILHTIYVSDREGRVLFASADKVRPNEVIYINDRSYFKSAQSGNTAITGPLVPRGQRFTEYALLVSSPYYLDNGNFGGVVAAAVNIKTLEQIIAKDHQLDSKSTSLALVSPSRGPLFTIGGVLDYAELHSIHQQIIANDQVVQIADYLKTFSVAPLSTSNPMWVAVVPNTRVIVNLVVYNLVLALLVGIMMAVTFGNVINSNRRQREKELEKKRQLAFIGEMAATVAHELRNPLTYIKGKLSLQPQMADEDNYLMLEEVERIETIINDILLSAKPIPLQLEKVVLTNIVSDSIRIMSAQATEKQVTIQTSFLDCDIIIKADRVQLRHVFINLIKNATEAITGPGLIAVTVKRVQNQAVVCIQDTGEGMTEQELRHIGRVFYTTKKGGTGLGVSTCQRIIKAHQGKMEISSSKTLGTLVTVILPIEGSLEA
ncbi:MAG: ATP-binding protein [Methylocystaceae bacterium]